MAHDAPPERPGAPIVRIGFLGPEGTFTEEALLSEPAYAGADISPMPSLVEVLEAVHQGTVNLGFIPLVDCAPMVVAKEKAFAADEGSELRQPHPKRWAHCRA